MIGTKTPPPEPADSGPRTPKPEPSEWLIETTHGRTLQAPDLATLHRWVIERRVTREDRISRDGRAWQRVGEVADLVPFFDIVDSAERARRADTPNPHLLPAPPPIAAAPIAATPMAATPMAATPVAPGSTVWVDRGAFPQVEDHTETKIVPALTSHVPLLLKLGLTTVVAAAVAFAGIALHNYRSPAPTPPQAMPTPPPEPGQPAVAESPPSEPATAPMVEPEPDTPEIEPAEPKAAAPPPPAVHRKGRSSRAERLRAIRAAAARHRAAAKEGGLAPQNPAAQGYAALNRRQFDRAIVLFKQALAGNPTNGTALFGLAEAYRETGQKSAALRAYRHYIRMLPSGPDAGSARLQVRVLEGKR